MAGLFDSLMKGLSDLAPQDDPDIKLFNLQNELKELSEKEEKLYAAFGRQVYADKGKDDYPDIALQLDAVEADRTAIMHRVSQAQAEKEAKEKAAAELAAREERSRCPVCDAHNPDGTKFCRECGTKLESDAYCCSCGAELGEGMRFCGECGTRQ